MSPHPSEEYDEDTRSPVEVMAETPAPSTVVLRVTGYDAKRVEEMIADRLFEMSREKLVKMAETKAEEAVTAVFEEQIREKLSAECDKILTEGWRRTTQYGEPSGPPVSLRERISQVIEKRDHYDRSKSWVDDVIKEQITALLKVSFAADIAKAQAAFKSQVDDLLRAKIAEGLRNAFGLK